jgi:hypothetical protein
VSHRGTVRTPAGRVLLFVLVVGSTAAACGGATQRTGRTVTFSSAGNFPPATIVGTYSVQGCEADTHTLVGDALLYYRHSNGAPGPADLYYYDMREAYAHFQADGCTSEELGQAMKRRLNARQRAFLLHNVASDLSRVFHAALDGG